ncbi:hypothetical protein Tco_0705568 [Tanacetum coccineum]|uniref:Uncharacterized protein n=1 Tax=Tanacetum coccineum TaxID=301880 RepID=A0ABQ4Y6F6_9ASTR
MLRTNPHATIVPEEQLVLSGNRLKITKNNQRVASDTNITDTTLRSDSNMNSEGQDSPLNKLTNTIKGTYKFRIEIPDTMIKDAFKKLAGYKYC